MPTRIALNGFGRIGRAAFKIALEHPSLDVVAINDLTDTKTLAHLLKYDTIYGRYEKSVNFSQGVLIVDGKSYKTLAEREPAKLPWRELGVEVVLECTGVFRDKEGASGHLKAGARKVIISAPAKGEGVKSYILGVNAGVGAFEVVSSKNEEIIDNASCTTNCIAPIMKILQEELGLKKAMMTTIHSYTADQNLVDGPHKDLRRGRAAASNIVPTTTGAARATSKVLPALEGKFDGLAIRVPTSNVSLADITAVVLRKVTSQEVNKIFQEAAKSPQYQGIVGVTEDEVVSSDFIKDPRSAIIDLSLTQVVDGNLIKVIAWYDNEWGYAARLVELASKV